MGERSPLVGLLAVNSLHHQCVDQLGEAVKVTARAVDGAVEGLELDERTIAVQWHPELLADRDHDPIFAWLVKTACLAGSWLASFGTKRLT